MSTSAIGGLNFSDNSSRLQKMLQQALEKTASVAQQSGQASTAQSSDSTQSSDSAQISAEALQSLEQALTSGSAAGTTAGSTPTASANGISFNGTTYSPPPGFSPTQGFGGQDLLSALAQALQSVLGQSSNRRRQHDGSRHEPNRNRAESAAGPCECTGVRGRPDWHSLERWQHANSRHKPDIRWAATAAGSRQCAAVRHRPERHECEHEQHYRQPARARRPLDRRCCRISPAPWSPSPARMARVRAPGSESATHGQHLLRALAHALEAAAGSQESTRRPRFRETAALQVLPRARTC